MLRFRQTLIVAAIAAAISTPASYAQAQRGRGGAVVLLPRLGPSALAV